MNKIRFFNDLEKYLKMYKVGKIDEILRDYEEMFIEGVKAGQTEEQIIKNLGEPSEIAFNYSNSSANRNIEEEKRIIKYNIAMVRGRCVWWIMMFVIFLVAIFMLFAVQKSVSGLIILLCLDATCLPFTFLEFKKLNKYKKIQEELNDISKKDI